MADSKHSNGDVARKEKNYGDELPEELQTELHKLQDQFTVDQEMLKQIVDRFQQELREGLQEDGQNIAMYVTWVLGFPSGKEQGAFLTIDLGGTNLRICYITLHGGGKEPDLEQHEFELPEHLKTGEAAELWTFIAKSLQAFIEEQQLQSSKEKPLKLGFTFSYPAIQDHIDHGVLQTWTKGFDIKGVEGEDVASQLRDAMSEQNLCVELIAVVNDTTGAMIASAYNDPETIIGAIFGTGCNAAYMDKISSIPKVQSSEQARSLTDDTPMAINCEYGAFDNARRVLPLTKYDETIDAESPRPGEQMFEKMSAGLYLGEIYRLVLLDLHSRDMVLRKQDTKKFEQPYCVDTGFLSAIENDDSPDLENSRSKFQEMFDIEVTIDELQFSKHVAKLIAIRGARLCATGIAALCRQTNTSKGHVAADGSVANKHPQFKKRWARALGEILDWGEGVADGDEAPIVMTSAEDGSGIGAAVIAAMTLERYEKGQKAGIKGSL